MSSEFPMSFPEESQVASVKPERKPEKRKTSQESGNKNSPRKPSFEHKNVIPLSRAADSMIAPLSEMADPRSRDNSALGDYPLSEFAHEESRSAPPGKRKVRMLRRSLLGLTLAGLWVAIATGHLHSEHPLVEQLRTQLALVEPAADELLAGEQESTTTTPAVPEVVMTPSEATNSESLNSLGSAQGVLPAAAQSAATASTAPEAASGNPQKNEISTSGSVVGERNIPETPQALNATAPAQPMRVPAIPGSVSSADVEKTVKLFLAQGSQLNELEQHLAQLLMQHGSVEKLDGMLDAMELRHRQALESIQTLRNKRKSGTR